MTIKNKKVVSLNDYEKVQIAQVQGLLADLKDLFNDFSVNDCYHFEKLIADLQTIHEDFEEYVLYEESEE